MGLAGELASSLGQSASVPTLDLSKAFEHMGYAALIDEAIATLDTVELPADTKAELIELANFIWERDS